MFWDVFLDSFIDSLKVLPIVFVVYVIIEYIEAREAIKHKMAKSFESRFSPFFGAVIGIVPQCGFSVVATKLYQGGYIYLGTLLAVYFATSDEAVPILFSRALMDKSVWADLGLLIAIKFCYAVVVGFVIDAIIKHIAKKQVAVASSEFAEESFEHDDDGCCGHGVSAHRNNWKSYLIHPLLHSLKIFLYIFAVNIIMGVLIEIIIGEANFAAFLTSSKGFQPLFSALVGLIPNCASSVFITELYADGLLGLGAALAGLTVNSGLGLAVLIKDRTHIKRTLLIILLMFTLSLVLGYVVILIAN